MSDLYLIHRVAETGSIPPLTRMVIITLWNVNIAETVGFAFPRSCGYSTASVSANSSSLISVALVADCSLERWDSVFESHSKHGCLCTFILSLCCHVCR
jgi:hypothetical protein